MGCAHFEYTSTTNAQGQTASSVSIGWNCAGGITVSSGNGTYPNVSRAEFVIDGGDQGLLSGVSALSFSASGGAQVISLR